MFRRKLLGTRGFTWVVEGLGLQSQKQSIRKSSKGILGLKG